LFFISFSAENRVFIDNPVEGSNDFYNDLR